MGDFWVFGYGSLMWNPGFQYLDRQRATLDGFHRSLCIYSWVHRGTREQPGLVFGLDHGGQCEGIAYCISDEFRDPVIDYLRERELVTDVYLEQWQPVRLENGAKVDSILYVVDRLHQQYAGKLDLETQCEIVATAKGKSGENPEYIFNTHDHLIELDIEDSSLRALTERLRVSLAV